MDTPAPIAADCACADPGCRARRSSDVRSGAEPHKAVARSTACRRFPSSRRNTAPERGAPRPCCRPGYGPRLMAVVAVVAVAGAMRAVSSRRQQRFGSGGAARRQLACEADPPRSARCRGGACGAGGGAMGIASRLRAIEQWGGGAVGSEAPWSRSVARWLRKPPGLWRPRGSSNAKSTSTGGCTTTWS